MYAGRFYITYCRWYNFVATSAVSCWAELVKSKCLTMYIYFTMFALYISVSIKILTRSESFHTTRVVVLLSLSHILKNKNGPIGLAIIFTTFQGYSYNGGKITIWLVKIHFEIKYSSRPFCICKFVLLKICKFTLRGPLVQPNQ